MAVVYGYGQAGAEGQTAYAENGISRTWKYDSMVAFIRSCVSVHRGALMLNE